MYALIENNEVKQVGSLSTLFPNTSGTTESFAISKGALKVVEGEQKDQRFYWVSFSHYEIQPNKVIRVYSNTPKELEDVTQTVDGVQHTTKGLKSNLVAQLKVTANSLLQPSDWMVLRQLSRGVGMSHIYEDYRTAVVAECARVEDLINNCDNVDSLMDIKATWPEQPAE